MLYIGIAFIVAFSVLILLLNTPLAAMALDHPNHRSLHTNITPRTGGVAVMAGIIIAWLLLGKTWLWIVPVLLLLSISLVDDLRSMPVRWRLLAQLTVSTGLVAVIVPETPLWLMLFIVLAITWMINLYNFMDGSDGLAGGMAFLGFGSYAFAAYLANDIQFVLTSGAITGASGAFLLFNFYPARIFMGDGGSVPLGLLAGAMGLYGYQGGLWPVWFPPLVFSPFIVDASVTLFKRLLKREKIWHAHRNHYYQRLIQMGWGHRKTALAEYTLMLSVCITAIILISQPLSVTIAILIVWAVIYALLMWAIDRSWAKRLT